MKYPFKIADNLSLPIEAVTMVFAILAQRGSGKSYTAAVINEEMLESKMQTVTLDPTGVHWGLKSSADGKSAGYPVFVFGGEHGDFPLDANSGEIIASAIVEHRFSAVLDLSLFSNGEMYRFGTAFLETLYLKNREALHLFVDEADIFAPQTVRPETARLLGAMEAVVRRGRKRGLGVSLITQRPAVLNKNVLTQADVLVAMRLSHKNDTKPIEEWAAAQADMITLAAMKATLPGLETGTAWFWSPRALNIFEKIKVRTRRTFDSGATPKPGQRIKAPKVFAEVDKAKLGQQLTALVEEKKANDPSALKAEIARLKKTIERQAVVKTVSPEELKKAREEGVLAGIKRTQADLMQFQKEVNRTVGRLEGDLLTFGTSLRKLIIPVDKLKAESPKEGDRIALTEKIMKSEPPRYTFATVKTGSGVIAELPQGEKAVLIACVQNGQQGTTREEITILTGYKRSTRDAYIQRLRTRLDAENNPLSPFVEVVGNQVVATAEGIQALGDSFQPLPTGDELREYWFQKLPEGERKILKTLVDSYPDSVTRESLGETTGFKRSTRDAYIQRLSVRRLVNTIGRGEVKASDILFG